MHPFVKENREGYKRNRKNPPNHTAHLSKTQQNVWRGFFSTAKPFVLKGTQKKRKRKEPVISELEKKMTVIWWFSFSRKKQQLFGGQHKCFYKECSVAEATQYDKSPWWVEMRVISLKKKKTFSMTLLPFNSNPRYKMSDFHSIPRALQSGLDKKASVQ